MARTVTPIPATRNKFSSKTLTTDSKKRVAAYARVSTDMDEQFTSFELQVEYYTQFINKNKDWKFVKVYKDEGISGTSAAGRPGFQKMIKDALDGKIDLIITKSVSRFARNTLDSLTTIRQLKEKGVEVYFEKENVWSLDSKGEFMLTLMASFAQEESRSISDNIRWSVNKKFENGKFSLPYKCFLGYERGPDGLPVVNEEQAVTVRKIFMRYLAGFSPKSIAKSLEQDGDLAPKGGQRWSETTVASILRNEKYAGNAILQKHYTIDFLDKKKRTNNGEVTKYYVNDSHEAIVSQEVFDLVQKEIVERRTSVHASYATSLFSGKVRCGECGGFFGAKVWHSTDQYRRTIYRCNKKYGNKEVCGTGHITEDKLKATFMRAAGQLLENRKTVIKNLEFIKEKLFSTAELEQERDSLEVEIEITKELYRRSISAAPIKDASGLDAVQVKYQNMLTRRDELRDEIVCRKNKRIGLDRYIRTLKETELQDTEFSEELFIGLVDHMTVYSKSIIGVTFRDGQEIRVNLTQMHNVYGMHNA